MADFAQTIGLCKVSVHKYNYRLIVQGFNLSTDRPRVTILDTDPH